MLRPQRRISTRMASRLLTHKSSDTLSEWSADACGAPPPPLDARSSGLADPTREYGRVAPTRRGCIATRVNLDADGEDEFAEGRHATPAVR
jgi:hypothetical protein